MSSERGGDLKRLLLTLAALAAAAGGAALVGHLIAASRAGSDETRSAPVRAGGGDSHAVVTDAGGPARPDVFLIVVDTLRADQVGCYGGDRSLTPTIDRLAARGTRFEHALAPSSWTAPSMASVLTGLWPEEHGVTRGVFRRGRVMGQEGLPEGLTTLAEVFSEQGYLTIGVVANSHLTAPLGFAQGFDHFGSLGFSPAGTVFKWFGDHDDVAQARDRPRFVWIHFLDPHDPYVPRQPWFDRLREENGPEQPGEELRRLTRGLAGLVMREMLTRDDLDQGSEGLQLLRDGYGSEVAFADRAVSRVLTLLGATDETIVAFISDHGEEFREHGGLGHRKTLYSELVHVPFIISQPGRLQRGLTVANRVSLVDLFPTLLELAGLPAAEAGDLSGRSLVRDDGTFGGEGGRPLFTATVHQGLLRRSVAVDELRLVHDVGEDRYELFDEAADPRNQNDLARSRPDDLARLRAELNRHHSTARPRAELPPPVAVPDELAEQLRELGYIE